jgi:hypothetical protein
VNKKYNNLFQAGLEKEKMLIILEYYFSHVHNRKNKETGKNLSDFSTRHY